MQQIEQASSVIKSIRTTEKAYYGIIFFISIIFYFLICCYFELWRCCMLQVVSQGIRLFICFEELCQKERILILLVSHMSGLTCHKRNVLVGLHCSAGRRTCLHQCYRSVEAAPASAVACR